MTDGTVPAWPGATAPGASCGVAQLGDHDRLLFEANPLPLWVYDLETLRFLDVNDVACRRYGYSRDEFLAMTIRDIRPAEDIALVEESVRTTPSLVFNSGVWRHRLKDGTLIDVEITSHEMLYRGRRTRCVCPIDVTQRLVAEAALRESEAGLRRAQGMARLAHVITRPDGSFERWSETLPALARIEAARMPKTTREWMQRVVHPEDRARFRASSLEAAASGARVEVEYRVLHADGSIVHVRQMIEPIAAERDAPGRRRWFSTLQDVTEQKQAEGHVMRLNDELEQRVRERTAAAERANRAKSEFLSNMSHELRTPLNAILGFGQLLTVPDGAQRSGEKQAMFAEQIVKAGRHLLTLINEILDLAQIEAGKLSVTIDRVALAEVLAECEAMIEPLAAQRGVRLTFPQACALAVSADRTRLKQVLLNLLSNAVKYDRERGAVTLECSVTEAGCVRIAVRDTGAGLRPEQIDVLFQPFNRLGQPGGSSQGTGIGLVITKRLVEMMGGRIGVSSAPGLGSIFWIELPLAAQGAVQTMLPGFVDAVQQGHAAAVATVLCVEDNPSSLSLLQEVLAARSELQLLSASNGRLGVELARAHRPAVILMDNNMPELSGSEAQAILRHDSRTAHIPVIALSANAMPSAIDAALAAGFFRYLTKPFDVPELMAALDAALEVSRTASR